MEQLQATEQCETKGAHAVAAAVFSVDERTPGRARHWLRERLRDWQVDALADPAELCTSELVSNALRHAAGEVQVLVTLRCGRVRVEVHDDDVTELPVVRRPDESAESGRGLLVVQSVAEVWGVDIDGCRKAVWFEVA